MKKIQLALRILFLFSLTGCTFPPAVSNLLGIQNQSIDCDEMILGVLIGEESDPIAQEQMDGYELALQQINANGGVNGCELQLTYQHEASDEDSQQTYMAVRALVEEDHAIAFVGATSNAASMYAASLSNYFGMPFVIPSASGAHILPEENHWAFRFHANEQAYADISFEMVRENWGEDTPVSVIFEDNTFGNDAGVAAVNAINASNLEVAGYFPFDAAQTSYAGLVSQVYDTQAQVFYLIFSSPAQASNILKALQDGLDDLDSSSDLIARAGGFVTHQALLNEEDDEVTVNENLILVTRWIGDSIPGQEDPFFEVFAQYTKEKYGENFLPTQYHAEAYKSLMIMAEELQAVLKSDSAQDIQQVRETLRQELFNYKENSSVWGGINFSAGGQNQSDLVLMQLQDGKWMTIYPADRAETDPKMN